MYEDNDRKLVYSYDSEILCIEAWGENALRLRATKNRQFTGNDWALNRKDAHPGEVTICAGKEGQGGADGACGTIENGKIRAVIDAAGVAAFYHKNGRLLLKENFRRLQDEISMAIKVPGREYHCAGGENYQIAVRFVANEGEKIFGMGQYQQHQMNMKGCLLELAQRNSQVSVPFYVSSLNYGFLWNNPGIGQVMFANNGTEWNLRSSKEIDYLVIAGDSPAEIEENYMSLTGKPPMMPEYGMGFWQSKLRYASQEELLQVAGKYRELGIPLDVIVADFFHWTNQGEFQFDPVHWPDVPRMCRELEEMGTRLLVSVWPTVDHRSRYYGEMLEKGFLVRTETGVRITTLVGGNEVFYDPTNPEARTYVWEKIKKNYWDQGARLFWLDMAEPEYSAGGFENYHYYIGTMLETGNYYPNCYLQGFYEGMSREGDSMPLSLIRSAWAGCAKYGALVWSGDIVSSFECFNRQVRAGLSMAMAGIPWWTTDTGGFHGARGDDPAFRELFARWFAYSCFCPVMRLHGDRAPHKSVEGSPIGSGADNEIWSFGEEIYAIARNYIFLRERMRDYLRAQMELAHEKGTPVMRPLFYDFPQDKTAWEIDDSYLFGPDLLVAPVLEAGARERTLYLPGEGEWVDVWSGNCYEGGRKVTVDAPIERIPVFARKDAEVRKIFRLFGC